MAFEQRENSGALFKNDRKERDNQPDYTGNGIINGQEVRISAWIKEGRSGKFMSLSFTAKDEQRQAQKQQRNAPPAEEFQDDSIPF